MDEHTATEIAYKNGYNKGFEDASKALDLVKVVWCRDCRLYDGTYCSRQKSVTTDKDYCSYAERK